MSSQIDQRQLLGWASISAEELTWLGERVEQLGQIVHAVCTDRIAALAASAKAA